MLLAFTFFHDDLQQKDRDIIFRTSRLLKVVPYYKNFYDNFGLFRRNQQHTSFCVIRQANCTQMTQQETAPLELTWQSGHQKPRHKTASQLLASTAPNTEHNKLTSNIVTLQWKQGNLRSISDLRDWSGELRTTSCNLLTLNSVQTSNDGHRCTSAFGIRLNGVPSSLEQTRS